MGETTNDPPGIIDRVQLLLCTGAGRSLGHPSLVKVIECWGSSPKEKLTGRPTVVLVAQVEMEEYRVFARLLLQVGDCLFGLGDIRGSNVDGRVMVQESLLASIVSGLGGTRKRVGTFAVSLPTLLFGLVIMTTLPVRSGRSSSFHLGLLSFSEPARPKAEGSWLEEVSGAEDDMERRGNREKTDSR